MQYLLHLIFEFLKNMTFSQLVSLFVCAVAITSAASIIRKGLSIVLMIIGILAGLYFLAPSLYIIALNFLLDLFRNVADIL